MGTLASLLGIPSHPHDVLGLLNQDRCGDSQRLRGPQKQTKGRLPLAPLQFAVVGTVDVRTQRELVLSDSEPLTQGSNSLPKRLGRKRIEGCRPAGSWLCWRWER